MGTTQKGIRENTRIMLKTQWKSAIGSGRRNPRSGRYSNAKENFLDVATTAECRRAILPRMENGRFSKAGRQRSLRDKIMVTTLAPAGYCSA